MDATFAERLRKSFAAHADLPAIEGRERALSYRELDHASATLARALKAAGVKPGDIVPLLLHRSPALVVAQVALIRLGAAYAPIDLTSPVARQQAMLREIGPSVVVIGAAAQTSGAVQLPDGCATVRAEWAQCRDCCNGAANNGAREHAEAHGMPPDDVARAKHSGEAWTCMPPHALAYVMFTSGTTGTPKGVMIPHSGIVRLVCESNFAELRANARWAFLSSPAFDASTLEVWAPLLNGGCCVIQEIAQPTLDDIAEFVLQRRITDMWLTASLFSAMVDDRPDAFANLQQLLTGGERVSPRHARTFLETHSHARLVNGYGPTENTTFTLCQAITLADTDNVNGIPIGTPIRGTTARIGMPNDAASNNSMTEGELLAGGAGVALGYLHDDALTATKFIEEDGTRWYRTGDMVRQRADGVFEFVGRVDRQVKLQGNRVELDEIERVLSSCPGVMRCVVIVRGATNDTRHLVACYTTGDAPPATADIAAFLRAHLAPPAVPSRLVAIASIPLTTTGKVDEAAVVAMLDKPTEPVRNTPAAGIESVSALHTDVATETERQLMTIWRQYLPDARINRSTSFLEAGGTSLLALQVSAQVRRRLGKNLTPIDVLRLPVLADQAQAIEAADAFEFDKGDQSTADLDLPLTQMQRAQLQGAELDDSGSSYLVHVALHVQNANGAINLDELRRVFTALAARHPAMRMVIPNETNAVRARVRPSLASGWWSDHDTIASRPADLHWPQELMRVINRPLNLARDGVMRVDAWPIADESLLLVWTIHHIAIDEASIDRALIELDALLQRTPLQPVYGSPLGFATFEKAWTDRDAVREWPQLFIDAWRGHPAPLPRAPGRGREFELGLPRGLSDALLSACERWGITPFAPLLTAYGLALQDVFGPENRFVCAPFSRRVEAELIEPLGCLIDLNYVEAGARTGESEGDALARVQADVLKLQRPTFFPHRAVANAVAKRDPEVERRLNGFGFTWRINPTRHVELGNARASLLRVQQEGARFGVALHSWLDGDVVRCSVEALAAAIDDGRAEAITQSFVRRLQSLCTGDALIASHSASLAIPDTPSAESEEHSAMLRRAWSQWVGTPVAEIVDSSDFLRSGGNSLTAMRMMTQLRREHGLRIGAGEFLARPTFRNLRALAEDFDTRGPEYATVIGQLDAPQIIVMLPGDLGPTVSSYAFAGEVQHTLGADYAVVIIDLEMMLSRAPAQGTLAHLRTQIDRVIQTLGWPRVAAFVGSSSGGIFALQLARQSPLKRKPVVWLLDTYVPQGPVQRAVRAVVSPVARLLLRSRKFAGVFDAEMIQNTQRAASPWKSPMALRREAVHEELFKNWNALNGDVAHLVQARQTAREIRLLWRRRTNGFNARNFAHFDTRSVEGNHSDFIQRNSLEIAEFIRASLLDNDRRDAS